MRLWSILSSYVVSHWATVGSMPIYISIFRDWWIWILPLPRIYSLNGRLCCRKNYLNCVSSAINWIAIVIIYLSTSSSNIWSHNDISILHKYDIFVSTITSSYVAASLYVFICVYVSTPLIRLSCWEKESWFDFPIHVQSTNGLLRDPMWDRENSYFENPRRPSSIVSRMELVWDPGISTWHATWKSVWLICELQTMRWIRRSERLLWYVSVGCCGLVEVSLNKWIIDLTFKNSWPTIYLLIL